MIINSVKILNITSFQGEHLLSFNHQPGRTISVLSGENGAGKTSLLQALKIALYGQFLFNNNKKKYLSYLGSFIRNNEPTACVQLDFQLRTLSGVDAYSVLRSWKRKDGAICESLSILKEGRPYQDIASKFYQEFIFSIVPLGMMDLFFFDGEKINSLGESLSSGEISNAVKKLIGLTAVDNLEEAVRKHLLDSLKGKVDYPALQKELEELDGALREFHKKGEVLHQQYAENNEMIRKSLKLLGNKETAFFETGGNLVTSLEGLQEKKRILQDKVESSQNQLRELSQDTLPLCVLSEELKELSDQLVLERETGAKQIVRDYTKDKARELEDVLTRANVSDAVRKTALEVLSLSDEVLPETIHDFSSKQTDTILAAISKANDVVRPQVHGLFVEMKSSRQELEAIESAIEKTPKNSEVADVLSDMRDLNNKIADYERKHEEIAQQKKRLESDVSAVSNKKKALIKQIEKWDTDSKSEELANRFPQVLELIKNDLFERRLETFQRLVLHNVKTLFRKDNLIYDVKITPDFSVELFGLNDSCIDLRRLSAGEQQMLATAIQWALASLASGSIPTIIDTPLARLDSYHRKSLVQNYYPEINQLILLSTDEEIDESLLRELAPYVCDVYVLQHNKEKSCTEISRIELNEALSAA